MGDFPVNIAVHPDGRFAAVLHAGYGPHQILVVDIGATTVVAQAKVAETFYGLEFTADGRRLFCSGAGAEVVRAFDFDAKTGDLGRETAIPLRAVKDRGVPAGLAVSSDARHIYVANANRNTVTVLDTAAGRAVETILAALHPDSPPGATPNSLALSPDERTLYVANANLNVVAAFDVSRRGRSRSLGFIPTGWYPTSVRVTPDGRHLLIANGTSVGALTPTAYVAENDLALGRLVEAVSRSKFWKDTAIFVVEDDAQNGPDHVDAHRTVAFVVGPHVRRGVVDSTMYSTCSMLRTMELILGLAPMSQFDAAAAPMFASFQAKPDLRPYDALPANVDLEERNTKLAWGADASGRMDFSAEDAVDDLQLNEVIWRSVKGADSPMPAPVRAGFVFAQAGDGDDD